MLGRSRSRRPTLPVVLAAALALVLGGCGALPSAPGPAPVPPAGAVDNRVPGAAPPAGSFDAPAVPPRAPGFEVGALPEQVAAPGPGSVPVRLVIPAIGVATRLVRLGLEPDAAMQVPGTSPPPGGSPAGRRPVSSGRR